MEEGGHYHILWKDVLRRPTYQEVGSGGEGAVGEADTHHAHLVEVTGAYAYAYAHLVEVTDPQYVLLNNKLASLVDMIAETINHPQTDPLTDRGFCI